MLELQGAQEQLLGQDIQTLRAALALGTLSSRALAEACLARIARLDPQIRAFAWIDPDYVRAQADRLDNLHKSGAPLGPPSWGSSAPNLGRWLGFPGWVVGVSGVSGWG